MNEFQQSVPMLFYRALHGIMPPFRRLFAEHDLTEQQWRVIRVLWQQDHQPLLKLAELTLLPSPSLVGVVDRMERDGLVVRQRSSEDRRVVQVRLTDRGRELQEQVAPQVEGIYRTLETKLDAEEWQVLRRALSKLGDGYGH